MKTTLGIEQQQNGLRTASFLIHCSLVDKKHRADFEKIWRLPYDSKKEETIPGWNEAHMRLLKKAKQSTNG